MIKKEYRLAFFLLLIPFIVAVLAVTPHYEAFTTTGDIVPVKDAGINGHVDFVYVKSGYTENWFQKFAVSLTSKNQIEFHPVDKETIQEDRREEETEGWRAISVERAIASASRITGQPIETFKETRMRILSETEQYEGDSFGLMLALGLIEEKTGEDFTKHGKYTIAGTGALEDDTYVGSVGAVRHKLLTAERNGADYFFVPEDKDTYIFEGMSNQEEAEQLARERGMTLQIVPVATIDEALAFLHSLP